MGEKKKTFDGMEPGKAVVEMTRALKRLLPLVDEDERIQFFRDLTGESGADNVSSMVHL